MSRTITIVCHGTGYSSIKKVKGGELLATMQRNIEGTQITLKGGDIQDGSFLVLEGPGHSDPNKTPLPNTLNPLTGDVKKTRFVPKALVKQVKKVGGILKGHGWDTNVEMAVNVVSRLNQTRTIDRINLIGWSRGAVTCIRLANRMSSALHPDLHNIKFNIFAIDPVAGWEDGVEDEMKVIPPRVKNFMAIFALDEMRNAFKPQDLTRLQFQGATVRALLPMPGVHNSTVLGGTDANKVVAHLACAFLHKCKTPLKTFLNADLRGPSSMAKAYARIIVDRESYKGWAGDPNYYLKAAAGALNIVGGGGHGRRDINTHANLAKYTIGGKGSYWINEHHRECFSQAWRGLYDFVFTGALGNTMKSVAELDPRAAAQLADPQSPLGRSLWSKNLIANDGGSYVVMKGAGSYGGDVQYPWPASLPLSV